MMAGKPYGPCEMMRNLYLNPFYLFAIAFLTAIGMYSMKLSGLYVNGDTLLTITFFLLCAAAVILGIMFNSLYSKSIGREIKDLTSDKILFPNAVFVVFGFALDCYASGGIPLLSILAGSDYDYKDFGLKTFHVFYMGYISAFSIVCFERYITTRRKKFLMYSSLGMVVTLLIVSRGAMMLLFVPMTLLYLSQRNKSGMGRMKKLSIMFTLGICFILLFGYAGDKRMISSGYKSDTAIMEIGIADDVFYKIPSGFFWVYLYASSPYGTLAAQDKFDNVDKGDLGGFVSASILPDFISKYVAPYVFSKYPPKRITPELTVGTGFSFALVSYGFAGVLLLFLWMCALSFLFAQLNKRQYIKSTCAILATASVLMIFDNMFIFSSCVMQLLIITIFTKFKFGRYSFI